ncbi:uncharacterized protein LOC114332078 isoform X2 [Diabrotica virgifera virgifera]|uniref:Uncharacterized protein LOC114332078 isoform X2 n=1 Tax=Diabrotica virgifera virgifera TaxID=50390 RepID=A0A6P7FMS0_DIAVI|nr:uncharacterized protein LOC114332078 isoform X2 [Diabrotica virgifera virgifera]
MVDLGGGHDGPIEHGFSNSVFIIPGIVFVSLSVFFGYKLYSSLMEKERRKEEKKRQRQQKKKK